jgi:hypothetical protein
MSGFFGTTDTTSKWGGYLKQAISNVETTFDSLLEQPPEGQEAKSITILKKIARDVNHLS